LTYKLNFNDWINTIPDPPTQSILRTLNLDKTLIFGSEFNSSSRVKTNSYVKTSRENVDYIANKFQAAIVGKSVNINVNGTLIRFTISGLSKSVNSIGKELADAAELATVKSLTHQILTEEDTGQQLFIDDKSAFNRWKKTFEKTAPAVHDLIDGNIGNYHIVHDATDTGTFGMTINKFTRKAKLTKDSWNPADVFLVDKSQFSNIVEHFNLIIDENSGDLMISLFNKSMFDFYDDGLLYPISLKQITSNSAKVELTNVPGKSASTFDDISIKKIGLNLTKDNKEVGLFTFDNNSTGKVISMQIRGFPHGYTTTQMEITSDGSVSGGRLGKVPSKVVDKVLYEFGGERIKSIKFFGKSFREFDKIKTAMVYEWFKDSLKNSNVSSSERLTLNEFSELIEMAKTDFSLAEKLCIKIQGLYFIQFFTSQQNNISLILNKLINGAKKIDVNNGFFIKIS